MTHLVRPRKRVGVIVPPPNPAVEPEMRMLLPAEIAIHVARLPVLPGTDLKERNRRWPSFFGPSVLSFGSLALDATLIAVSGPNYSLSKEEERSLTEELTTMSSAPVAMATSVIEEAFIALGCNSVTLVSPYPEWLTQRACSYWENRGLIVHDVIPMTEDFRPYDIVEDEVTEKIRELAGSQSGAILFLANGVMTIPAFVSEVAGTAPLLLSSNLCGAWWLMRQLGYERGSDVFEAAAPRLSATLRSTS